MLLPLPSEEPPPVLQGQFGGHLREACRIAAVERLEHLLKEAAPRGDRLPGGPVEGHRRQARPWGQGARHEGADPSPGCGVPSRRRLRGRTAGHLCSRQRHLIDRCGRWRRWCSGGWQGGDRGCGDCRRGPPYGGIGTAGITCRSTLRALPGAGFARDGQRVARIVDRWTGRGQAGGSGSTEDADAHPLVAARRSLVVVRRAARRRDRVRRPPRGSLRRVQPRWYLLVERADLRHQGEPGGAGLDQLALEVTGGRDGRGIVGRRARHQQRPTPFEEDAVALRGLGEELVKRFCHRVARGAPSRRRGSSCIVIVAAGPTGRRTVPPAPGPVPHRVPPHGRKRAAAS